MTSKALRALNTYFRAPRRARSYRGAAVTAGRLSVAAGRLIEH